MRGKGRAQAGSTCVNSSNYGENYTLGHHFLPGLPSFKLSKDLRDKIDNLLLVESHLSTKVHCLFVDKMSKKM